MCALFSSVSPSSMGALIQHEIDCMLLWERYFSKNERSVLIRLPHSEPVSVSHHTQQEIQSSHADVAFTSFAASGLIHLLEGFHTQLSLHSATLDCMIQHLLRWED